jgi:hypothetical protein
MSEVIYADEDKLKLRSGIVFDFVKLGTFLNSYLELQDRIIFHFFHDVEQRQPTFNLCRNIFCYAKEDGHLIWQVEQAYGRDHQPLEAVYKYIALHIRGEDGGWLSIAENGSIEVDHELDDGSEVGGHGVIALEWPLSEFSMRGLRISASINFGRRVTHEQVYQRTVCRS